MSQTIIIPKYIREVKLSEHRLKKYYELGKKHPKAAMYKDKKKYDWRVVKPYPKTRKFLVNLTTNERVIANPKAQGTPRILTINGQKIYNGEISKHIRNKVLSEIKATFTPYVEQLNVITKYPIGIQCEIHDTIREPHSKSLWDLDNRSWPYIKAFQDCLTGNKDKNGNLRNKRIIEDDSVLFIVKSPQVTFIPVDTQDERKIVFIITDETDTRIIKFKRYIYELKQHFKMKTCESIKDSF